MTEDTLATLTEKLDLCGCGRPEEAIRHIRECLRMVKEYLETPVDGFASWLERTRKYFGGNEGAEYFMWYWLNHQGFTEHGGQVPGWLTDDGEALLQELNSLNLDDDQ